MLLLAAANNPINSNKKLLIWRVWTLLACDREIQGYAHGMHTQKSIGGEIGVALGNAPYSDGYAH